MAKTNRKQKKHKFRIMDLVMGLLLLIGLGVLSYPFVQDRLNDFLDQQVIQHYQNQANTENEKAIRKQQEKMEKANKKLAKEKTEPGVSNFNNAVNEQKTPKKPQKTYYQQHTIGVINIPKIKARMPIFDHTNDVLLAKGACLLDGTSYPTGGESTHAVISAHRGLPEAKLFTDLPDLKIGDKFYIEINKKTLAYQVDSKKVIEPTDTSDLKIVPGKDLVTLMTCTPYMINSERLLVTGHRVPYHPKDKKAIDQTSFYKKLLMIATILVILLVLAAIIAWLHHRFWLAAVRKKRLPLKFYLLDAAGNPVKNFTFRLFLPLSKHPVTRDGEPLEAISDENGLVALDNVRGGAYHLRAQNVPKNWRLKAKVKRRKDDFFTIQVKKPLTMKKEGDTITAILPKKEH
ncbi:class C sortase [Enterococcus hirae]|nr:class C sortase [Enterococcus hirae]